MISTRLFALFALAASCPLSQALFKPQVLDVWIPPITYPNNGTVWNTGDGHHVRWNTSNAPTEITNPQGTIHLVKNGVLDIENPLAQGFSLWDGQVWITVPDVESGLYQINLMGDSANDSPEFQINNLNQD